MDNLKAISNVIKVNDGVFSFFNDFKSAARIPKITIYDVILVLVPVISNTAPDHPTYPQSLIRPLL